MRCTVRVVGAAHVRLVIRSRSASIHRFFGTGPTALFRRGPDHVPRWPRRPDTTTGVLSAPVPPAARRAGHFDCQEAVVGVVLERNPTLDQMRATAAIAAARLPAGHVTRRPDPRVHHRARGRPARRTPTTPPASRSPRKLFYPGKPRAEGRRARADALAAAEDVEDARLQLAEAARSALADYYLAVKATGVAEENAKLLGEFKQERGDAVQDGPGPAAGCSASGRGDRPAGGAARIAAPRAGWWPWPGLNTLMHLPPDAPLPPPADAGTAAPLPDAVRLRKIALGRPDVRAVVARVTAEEAALALAQKEYKPDVEVMAGLRRLLAGARAVRRSSGRSGFGPTCPCGTADGAGPWMKRGRRWPCGGRNSRA